MLAHCSRPSLRELFITICHQPPPRRPFHSRNNCNLFLFGFVFVWFLVVFVIFLVDEKIMKKTKKSVMLAVRTATLHWQCKGKVLAKTVSTFLWATHPRYIVGNPSPIYPSVSNHYRPYPPHLRLARSSDMYGWGWGRKYWGKGKIIVLRVGECFWFYLVFYINVFFQH